MSLQKSMTHDCDEECFGHKIVHRIVHKDRDSGFMGYTHALSALAVVTLSLGIIGLAFGDLKNFLESTIGSSVFPVIILSINAVLGSVMLNDLDNTSSRARNDLGLFGVAISGLFRGTSLVVQNTVRTKRDPAEPNPHRGFYHTLPGAALISFLVLLGTRLDHEISLSMIPNQPVVTLGWLIGMVTVFILTHLALSTLAKEYMDKVRKSALMGEVIAFGISAVISIALLLSVPQGIDFWWLSVAIFIGMTIHVMGDIFTTAGAPIWFPIPINGKMWWNVRLSTIKAGGDFENKILVKLLTVLSVIGIILTTIALIKM